MLKAVSILLFATAFIVFSGALNISFAQNVSASGPATLAGLQPAQNTLKIPSCAQTMLTSSDVCIAVSETPQPQEKPEKKSKIVVPVANMQNADYAPDNAVLDSGKIFDEVNQYRASIGLSSFEKDNSVCELARVRTLEIPSEIRTGTLHSGLYKRNLPYWVWENAKYGSNEDGTVAWWLASPIHHESIVGNYKYSCVVCTGSYCSELFTSFVPK